MQPVENIEYPGFFNVPGYNLAISRDGRFVDLRLKRIREFKRHSQGYYVANIVIDKDNLDVIRRHRMLLLTFAYDKDHANLLGNHKNGIKGDDAIENLEWVTPKGNVNHAIELGLWHKAVVFQVRCVFTGEVKELTYSKRTAESLNMHKDTLKTRLVDDDPTWVYPEGKQYRTQDFEQNWVVPQDIDLALLRNGPKDLVCVRNLETGEEFQFRTAREAAKLVGVKDAAMSTWLSDKTQQIQLGEWQVKCGFFTPWREVTDLISELMDSNRRVYVVTIDQDGRKTVFPRAIDCARSNDLLPTTLDFRLKSNFAKVYPDGKRYGYLKKLQSVTPEMV